MKKWAYYNEFDSGAAAWLRELIKAGHIAPGEVDERSIEDVQPADVMGFKQVHCFAGIGVWSYALRLAGFPDDRECWTGSCPCQPFSAAGKGLGTADKRHLWPQLYRLISECKPDLWFGEQVASKDGLGWLDTVLSDLETSDYAAGAVDICAAGLGAPHLRNRLWIVAQKLADSDGWNSRTEREQCSGEHGLFSESSGAINLAHAFGEGRGQIRLLSGTSREEDSTKEGDRDSNASKDVRSPRVDNCRMANTFSNGRSERRSTPCTEIQGQRTERSREYQRSEQDGQLQRGSKGLGGSSGRRDVPGPTNGFWRDADWLRCRDNKWRPVEPKSQPLAHGITGRVGLLRGYGNAICAPVAQAFISSFLEAEQDQ